MFDHQKNKPLVLVPRESNPTGGVSSHLELLISALSPRVTHVYWHLPLTGVAQKALLLAQNAGSITGAREANVRRKIAQLTAQLHVRAQGWPSARLIHVHDVIAGMAAVRFRQQAGRPLPVLYTAHGPLSREIRMDMRNEQLAGFIERLEQEFYNHVDRVIAVDAGQAEILKVDFGVPEHKLTVIHNAVDITHVTPPAGDLQIPRKRTETILLLPRRLVEKNGPIVAVEALALLPPTYHLWIVGDGPLRSQVENRIRDLNLEHRVRLWGEQPRNNVIELMRHSDIVLVPSVPAHGVVEATSIAALEGMGLGKPIIASSIGGLAELIKPGETGLLVPPGDAQALAEAALSLERSALGTLLGRQAAQFIRHSWSAEQWAARTYAEYQSLW